MNKLLFFFTFTLLLVLVQLSAVAQTARPFTEGSVWKVQFVKTKPGMGLLYLKNLSEGWVKSMREAKIQGIIMDFKVLSAEPASKDDWDLLLMYELKNHASEDGLRDKMEAILNKMMGNEDVQQKASVARNDLRDLFGGKTMQELTFK